VTAQRESKPGLRAVKATFDLDAARAARREAETETFTFKWDGAVYSCLPAKEWPITVTARLAEGDLVSAIQLILGEDAEAFLATNPSVGDVESLMDALATFAGFNNAGE
jgi:hypothetical protein